jgi:hypothetical protein
VNIMQLVFLGKSSEGGESPTLYATDRHYIVQGYKVTDPALLTDMAEGEVAVEIYARLLDFLAEDPVTGPPSHWAPPVVHVKADGNLVLIGERLTDADIRHRLALPEHEDAIVLPKVALQAWYQGVLCA